MNIHNTIIKCLGILLVAQIALSGCNHEGPTRLAAEEETEPVQVTAYSAKSELFMEYDQPVAREKAGFLIHLTRIADFKPVTAGSLKMVFANPEGDPLTVAIPAPARPGIYKGEATLAMPGIR